MVEVGEGFIVQFDGGRGSCTQNVLKGEDLVLVVRRKDGLFLFEDGEGEDIAEEQKHTHTKQTLFHLHRTNTS